MIKIMANIPKAGKICEIWVLLCGCMNILPFIFSFLIIFALALSFASGRKQSVQACYKGLKGTFQALHQSWSKDALDEYSNACKTAEKDGKALPTKLEESKDSGYFRDNKCIYETQKFNLTKFEASAISITHPRYKSAAKLLKTLYQRAPFYKEGLEYIVLNALLNRGESPIIDLFEKDPKMDAIFYKMLKGTSTYMVETDKGYPSLFDYCTFTSSDEKFSYNMLSKPVLASLVGTSLMERTEE